jgi:hypothetical protein
LAMRTSMSVLPPALNISPAAAPSKVPFS